MFCGTPWTFTNKLPPLKPKSEGIDLEQKLSELRNKATIKNTDDEDKNEILTTISNNEVSITSHHVIPDKVSITTGTTTITNNEVSSTSHHVIPDKVSTTSGTTTITNNEVSSTSHHVIPDKITTTTGTYTVRRGNRNEHAREKKKE